MAEPITILTKQQVSARLNAEAENYRLSMANARKLAQIEDPSKEDRAKLFSLLAFLKTKEELATPEGREDIMQRMGMGKDAPANARIVLQRFDDSEFTIWYKAREVDGTLKLGDRLISDSNRPLIEGSTVLNRGPLPVELMKDEVGFEAGKDINISIQKAAIKSPGKDGLRIVPSRQEGEALEREALRLLEISVANKKGLITQAPAAEHPFAEMLKRGPSEAKAPATLDHNHIALSSGIPALAAADKASRSV